VTGIETLTKGRKTLLATVSHINRLLKNTVQQVDSGASKHFGHSGCAMGGSLEHHEALSPACGPGQRGEEVAL
jgi:hypothetical protein